MSGLIEAIKMAAMDAYEASNPCNLVFGTVTQASPLEIKLDNSLILRAEDGVLKLSRQVTDYEVSVTLDDTWNTESKSGGSGESSFSSHNHKLIGKHKLTIHNKLQQGEKVILCKLQGGQAYIVLDRQGVIG